MEAFTPCTNLERISTPQECFKVFLNKEISNQIRKFIVKNIIYTHKINNSEKK